MKSNTENNETALDPWRDQPDLVRQIIEQRPSYEQLCDEVAYILKRRLAERNIEIAAVTSRAKTLNSFLEKIDRKSYGDPINEITDFARVRVVSLYHGDLEAIEAVIREEFDVLEKVDKLRDKDVDQFGYGAVHFIARLGAKSFGARYDELKNLKCEIQTRTVLQDAWAILQHHLVYKNESDIPKLLQRKLNGLAGLFETADDQFQSVHDSRMKYLDSVRQLHESPAEFLDTDLNVDSLTEYLSWSFPERPLERRDGTMASIMSRIDHDRYPTLKHLDDVISSTASERESFLAENKDAFPVAGAVPALSELILALAYSDDEFHDSLKLTSHTTELIREWRAKAKDAN